MSLHGEYIADDSKYIRVVRDDADSLIRVLLHEDWYEYVKPLYDCIELISAGVSVENLPNYLNEIFEWGDRLWFELGANGLVVKVTLIGWIVKLVRDRVNLGKFTYKPSGYNLDYGENYDGLGTKLLELPVEG